MARQSLGSPQVCTFLTTHFSLMAAGSNPVGTKLSVLSSTFPLLRNLRNNFNLATYHCISLTNQLFHLQHHITTQPLDVYSWPAKPDIVSAVFGIDGILRAEEPAMQWCIPTQDSLPLQRRTPRWSKLVKRCGNVHLTITCDCHLLVIPCDGKNTKRGRGWPIFKKMTLRFN